MIFAQRNTAEDRWDYAERDNQGRLSFFDIEDKMTILFDFE